MDKTNRVQFEKPDIPELIQHYTVVDMHFHTRYSDGLNKVRQIVKRVRQWGIGIAITDHNDIRGPIEIDDYKDILSIPGVEITSHEGSHLLVYFYSVDSLKHFFKEHIQPNMGNGPMSSIALPMEEIIERARKFKTVVILPHPYCAAYTGVCNSQFSVFRRKRLFDLVDGVEAINSENLTKWNLQCAVLAFNLDRAVTGGSDGHALYQIGKVVSYADCKGTRKDFLDAVIKKRNKVIGKEIDIFRKVTSNGLKLRKNLRNYPDLIEKNFRYGCTVFNSKSKGFRDNIKRRLKG